MNNVTFLMLSVCELCDNLDCFVLRLIFYMIIHKGAARGARRTLRLKRESPPQSVWPGAFWTFGCSLLPSFLQL